MKWKKKEEKKFYMNHPCHGLHKPTSLPKYVLNCCMKTRLKTLVGKKGYKVMSEYNWY